MLPTSRSRRLDLRRDAVETAGVLFHKPLGYRVRFINLDITDRTLPRGSFACSMRPCSVDCAAEPRHHVWLSWHDAGHNGKGGYVAP